MVGRSMVRFFKAILWINIGQLYLEEQGLLLFFNPLSDLTTWKPLVPSVQTPGRNGMRGSGLLLLIQNNK